MKSWPLLLCLFLLASCGKVWRSRSNPETLPLKNTPTSLDQWSGRSDFTEAAWQIKSKP